MYLNSIKHWLLIRTAIFVHFARIYKIVFQHFACRRLARLGRVAVGAAAAYRVLAARADHRESVAMLIDDGRATRRAGRRARLGSLARPYSISAAAAAVAGQRIPLLHQRAVHRVIADADQILLLESGSARYRGRRVFRRRLCCHGLDERLTTQQLSFDWIGHEIGHRRRFGHSAIFVGIRQCGLVFARHDAGP